METPNLPQEILIDIFSLLPAKSIGKCRCLSKEWQTLLSTSQFIKSHLSRKPHEENLILIALSGSVHSAAAVADGAVSRKLQLSEICTEVAGSCDGLVLLVNDFLNHKFLVNPITMECVRITNSPLALKDEDSCSMYGLGYDKISDDYKIVALSYWEIECDDNSDCDGTFVDVYSVRRGVWKRVDSSPYDHTVPYLSSGPFVNGALHWLASDLQQNPSRSVIAAFNFADEVFDEIPAPSDVDVKEFVFYKLVVLGGCLCLVDVGRNGTDVWMMKEYGVRESWTKFTIEGESEFEIVKPLCFVGDDKIVFPTEGESLVVYNVKASLYRDMVVDGDPAMFVDGAVFVGSLVSPTASFDGVLPM